MAPFAVLGPVPVVRRLRVDDLGEPRRVRVARERLLGAPTCYCGRARGGRRRALGCCLYMNTRTANAVCIFIHRVNPKRRET